MATIYGYEFLQEVVIKTQNGQIVRLHLGELEGTYRLYGELFSPQSRTWASIKFDEARTNDPIALLRKAIDGFNGVLTMTNGIDRIILIENPCNAPFVNQDDQMKIINELGIKAFVTVN